MCCMRYTVACPPFLSILVHLYTSTMYTTALMYFVFLVIWCIRSIPLTRVPGIHCRYVTIYFRSVQSLYINSSVVFFIYIRPPPATTASALPNSHRAATAGKAGKFWSLPRFWVSICSYRKQLVKNILGRILDLAWLKFAMAALLI